MAVFAFKLLFLVVEHTMAEPFKVRVGDLLFELPAHTPGIVRPLPAAGAPVRSSPSFMAFTMSVSGFNLIFTIILLSLVSYGFSLVSLLRIVYRFAVRFSVMLSHKKQSGYLTLSESSCNYLQ